MLPRNHYKGLFQQWSQLILEMDKLFLPKETSSIIQDIVDQFRCGSQPHLRALLARYLMHKVHDSQRAIAEIEKACSVRKGEGILNSKETDCNLLSTYCHLFRQMVTISEPQWCEEGGAVAKYMETVRKYTEEAVMLSERLRQVPELGIEYQQCHSLVRQKQEPIYFICILHTHLRTNSKNFESLFQKQMMNLSGRVKKKHTMH